MTKLSDDDLRLIAAGWKQLRSGKWTHPHMPPLQGRVRPFSTAYALTILDADPKPTQWEHAADA